MRLSAKTLAAMLMVSALVAFQIDSFAQSRGNSRSSSTARSSSSATRSSSSSAKSSSSASRSSSSSVRSSSSGSKSSAVRQPSSSKSMSSSKSASTYSRTSTSASRKPSDSSSKVTRPSRQSQPQAKPQSRPQTSAQSKPQVSSQNKPQATRPETTRKPDISPADRDKKPTVSRPSGNKPAPNKPSHGDVNRPKPGGHKPDFKPGNHNKPVHVHRPGHRPAPPRIHPRERDFMHYSKPAYHWCVTPHYYGYRVRTLPVNVIRHIYGGVTYYYYDNIWYRPYNGYYVVSRPPFGVSFAANLIADAAWTAVKLSYYNTVANTYNQINENNEYIAQQNAVIAQNNALIAAQNQQIAQSQTKAQAAYSLANELGLIQSYAAADSEYYYQDGVFYSIGKDGQYYVIVPPAGALVETLPEDFDTIILKGKEYFKVDDTVYQMTITEGKPYFEVLGQMY